MPRATLFLSMSSNAFGGTVDTKARETARILREIADAVVNNPDTPTFRSVRDQNGSEVGRFRFDASGTFDHEISSTR